MNTQQLVEQYVPLANKLAYKKKKNLPNFVDIEELKSAAYMGLVEAASRYKPELGVQFSTFAYPRIFGAIHDYLREMGWGKRNESVKAFSLNTIVKTNDGEYSQGDLLESKKEYNSDEFMEVITFTLDNQAEQVLRYYFIDECSMKEVGEKFGVSESRVSQLIKRYKDRIRNDWDEQELRDLAA